MALPETRTLAALADNGDGTFSDVIVQKTAQEPNISTWFKKLDDGSEVLLEVKRARQGKIGTGTEKIRHIIDLTHTRFKDDGTPINTQVYAHMIANRSEPVDDMERLSQVFSSLLSSWNEDVIAYQS